MATTTSKAGYRSGRDLPTVAENIELLTGQRGNKLDKAITYRELADIGLITLSKAANNALSPSVAPGVLPDDTISRPVAPTGVIANGAFHTILVEWELPAYKGHAHAEVWRAEEDNRAKAVMVGTSAANLYSDAIGKGASVFYWVRFVNMVNVQGPFQGVAGVHAETSRDVQDILDELQGKIGTSHLVQELLTPIQSVSQLQIDLGDLDDALSQAKASIAALDAREVQVSEHLDEALSQAKASIAALDAREVQVSELLQHAQNQLGDNYISVTIIQEQLRQRIDTYNLNFKSFRDAVFSVDPTTGQITMDAVNAVRNELGAEIIAVSQHLDSVEAIVNTCVTRAEMSADFERLTLVEQQIDGIHGALTQTATKSEVTSIVSTVSQVQQSLDATNNALTQKAAQSQGDGQGQRLTIAEQQISASATANSATAQRIEQVKSQLELTDHSISSSITELAQSVATDKQATAQRLAAMEATITGQTAAISELQQVVTGDGSSLASKFERISASTDLAAEAAMQAALANASADIEQRKAAGSILHDQSVMATEQIAQAKTLEQLTASFDGVAAQILEEKTVRAIADESLAQVVSTIESAYKQADQQTQASISGLQKTVSDMDSALAQQITTVQASAASANSAASTAQSAADQAKADAATAAGIATGKGKVLIQSTVPAVADRLAQNLWIDTTGGANTPKRWNGTAWAAVTDKAATDAASAAAAAQATADAAATQATQNAAAIQSEATARANADGALAQQITTMEATITGQTAAIGELQQVVTGDGSSLASKFERISASTDLAAEAAMQAALANASSGIEQRKAAGKIRISQEALSNDVMAQAQTIIELTAEFDAEKASTTAALTEIRTTMTDEDQALSQRLDSMDAAYKAADSATNASVSSLAQAVSTADQALSQQISAMDVAYKQADAETSASIAAEQSARASGDQALSVTISQMDAAYKAADNSLSSRVATEESARANADGALSSRIDQVTANFTGADNNLQGQITSESLARANADTTLAQQITTVQASAASANSAASTAQSAADQAKADAATAAGIATGKGKVLIQSTVPAVADRLAQNLWIDTTGGANTPKRWNGTAWAAVTDKAATDAASAAAAAQATADAAKQQAATLSAAVQVQSQAIVDLQNGAQAMWTAKANAGGISAGIGLIAKSDGTSQVAISASQVFVFDPNSPNALSPLFAIDNGQVIMAEAIIRTATIQILNSQQITADYVKAGVSLSAPVINGGSIIIGSNFTVTASGAMTAWSATLRYVTSYYGTINYATIQNCTITEDCDVKGTIYAAKIVGDVVCSGIKTTNSDALYESTGTYVLATASVPGGRSHDCHLFCDGLLVIAESSGSQSTNGDVLYRGAISGELRVMSGSSKLASFPFMVSAMSGRVGSFMNEAVMAIGGVYVGRGEGTITVELAITSRTAEGDATNKATARVRVPAQSSKFSLIPKGSLLSIS